MLFSHFRSGRVVPTPPPAITALPTNVTYADVRGHRRMINGYSGNLFRLGCATASPTTLDIGQLPNGMPDMSGVTAWRNGSTAVFFEGEYNQVTGNFIAADSSAKRPLYVVDADENGFPALSMGYASNGTLALTQGLPSETIAVNRADVGMFMVGRPLGAGLSPVRYFSLESSVPGVVLSVGGQPSSRYTLYTFGNQNGFTNTLPLVNKLCIMGYVGTASGVKLHVDNRVTTAAANSSAAAVTAYWGKNTTSTASTIMDAVAMVTTANAPSDADADAIKAALNTIFSLGLGVPRKNAMVVCHHSLAFNGNLSVHNQTMWKQMMPSITKQLDVGQIGAPGKSLASMITEKLDLTRVYEPGVDRFIYYIGSAVNDEQALASGFANGDPALISSAANTIYNRYVTLNDDLVAQGSNVRIIVATTFPPLTSWWSGTTQDKADKAQVMLEVNQLLRDNAAFKGWSVSDEYTINLTGALGDGVHTNRLGEGRRAAIVAPVIDALLVA